MSKKIDLHMHTNASDGTWSPEEVIENVIKNNIEIFAIADHDETRNILETERLANENNLEFIRCIEFSAKAFDLECHILGYDVDIYDETLIKRMEKTRRNKYNRETRLIEMLVKDYGFKNVSVEEFEEYRRNNIDGVPSIKYLEEKGIAKNLTEFTHYKEKVVLSPDEDLPPAEEIIPMIKNAGGVTVLAHPSYHFPKSVMPIGQLDFFKDLNIDGIECYCTYNKPEENFKYYVDYCKKHNIAISGGSDCHGGYYKERKIGDPHVTLDMTNIISKMKHYKYLQNI